MKPSMPRRAPGCVVLVAASALAVVEVTVPLEWPPRLGQWLELWLLLVGVAVDPPTGRSAPASTSGGNVALLSPRASRHDGMVAKRVRLGVNDLVRRFVLVTLPRGRRMPRCCARCRDSQGAAVHTKASVVNVATSFSMMGR